MAMTAKKSFWAFLSGLNEEVLLKSGEEVELKIFYLQEEKTKKKKEKGGRVGLEKVGVIDETWLTEEVHGQLSVDLYEQEGYYIIESTIAGVGPEDIDITVEQDLITIRGQRRKEVKIPKKNYFYQECFWGKFFRTLVLPGPVEPDKVKAEIKNGILRIVLPKAQEVTISLRPK